MPSPIDPNLLDQDPPTDDDIEHPSTDEDDEDDDGSSEGNVTRAKRDLLKLGLSQGHLSQEQLSTMLPTAYMSPSEIETFFFTCATMGIKTPRKP